ncbi:unnamed protein product [Linum trigynum]|uniref:Uncharacterized protein n=1 Tax=Linum trigynum TaxID=586398 RepID=A0AAV2GCC2_9ROSI
MLALVVPCSPPSLSSSESGIRIAAFTAAFYSSSPTARRLHSSSPTAWRGSPSSLASCVERIEGRKRIEERGVSAVRTEKKSVIGFTKPVVPVINTQIK